MRCTITDAGSAGEGGATLRTEEDMTAVEWREADMMIGGLPRYAAGTSVVLFPGERRRQLVFSTRSTTGDSFGPELV